MNIEKVTLQKRVLKAKDEKQKVSQEYFPAM